MKAKLISPYKIFTVAFLLIALLITTSQASAQESGRKTPEERAKVLTEKMKTELSLTTEQEPKVEAINLKYAKLNQETISTGSNRKLKTYKTIKKHREEKDKELKEVLTGDQYKKYQEMVKEIEEKAKERRANR